MQNSLFKVPSAGEDSVAVEVAQPDAAPVMVLIPEYTVSSLATALKRTVEENYTQVRVRGEISGAKLHASGHLYFALKDLEAVIDAVCWRPVVSKLGMALEDGMDVICLGRVTTYPGRSKYQVIVEHIELAGQGALLKLLEERKQRLQAEGLFAAERKQPIPFLPRVIGIVTSPTGAVIRDILHRLRERCGCHVIVWGVAVQGEGAAAQVAAAIRGFNTVGGQQIPRPDVIIVARGGGSLEDLWAFNEELVVRAVADSDIPVISAVGHETDTTLIDFASDLRAPTPTAAAEKAVPVRAQLISQLHDLGQRLAQATLKFLEHRALVANHLGQRLPNLPSLVMEKAQKIDDWAERLQRAIHFRLTQAQAVITQRGAALRHPTNIIDTWQLTLGHMIHRLTALGQQTLQRLHQQVAQHGMLLATLAPDRVLERGYAIVKQAESDVPLTCAVQAGQAERVHVQFYDGVVEMLVERTAARPPVLEPPQAPMMPEAVEPKTVAEIQNTVKKSETAPKKRAVSQGSLW